MARYLSLGVLKGEEHWLVPTPAVASQPPRFLAYYHQREHMHEYQGPQVHSTML